MNFGEGDIQIVEFSPALPNQGAFFFRTYQQYANSIMARCQQCSFDLRPGMPVGWAPEVVDGARIVAAWAVPGDVVLVVGAGDVDRAVPLVLEALG